MKQLLILALLFIGFSANAQTKTKLSTEYYGNGSNPISTRVNGCKSYLALGEGYTTQWGVEFLNYSVYYED